MSWNNFSDQNLDEQNQSTQAQPPQPKKLIDSVAQLTSLNTRTSELSAKILADADQDTGLARQLTYLNISELNKSSSKETTYKTEEDITDTFMNKILNHNDEDILKGVNFFSVSSERKKRYDIYEQMLDSNYLAFRILRAYINGVLIKNAQTKSFINVDLTDEKRSLIITMGTDISNSYQKFIKSIIMKYKLQEKLKDIIVPKTLLYGNQFIEIVDLNLLDNISAHEQILMETEKYIDMTTAQRNIYNKKYSKPEGSSILTENDITFESNFNCYASEKDLISNTKSELTETSLYVSAMDQRTILEESGQAPNQFAQERYNIDALFEDSSFSSSAYDLSFLDDPTDKVKSGKRFTLEDISKLDMIKLKDIHLNYISPRNVIIIEKDSYIYGYLVVEDLPGQQQSELVIDSFKRFTNGMTGSLTTKEETKETTDDIVEKLTQEILNKVVHNIRLNKARTIGNAFNYFNTLNISDEALTSLKVLIYNKIKKKSKLKFRFLTPESIVNFGCNVDKFSPYSTSVFDPLVGPVKLYTLALMSSVVSRLSRAAVIRKWTIETGGKRNHKEIVDKTKNELKSKAISYDKINTLQNISEIVTDFRDMATVSINGQRYVDMEILPMNDRGLPLNDLNDLKNDIISAGGVPAVYLNLGDTIDLRETLVHLNITFANDIIDKQTSIEQGLDNLFNNIFKKVLDYNGYNDSDFYISNYCKAKLNPPLVLQIQSDEAMISTVSNILNLLDTAKLPVDPKDLYKRYIPSINWEELVKNGQTYLNSLGKTAIINSGIENEDPMSGA